MKYLLDVNALLAAIWHNHADHAKVFAWLPEKRVFLCPLSELGFLRVSSHPKAINAPMDKARDLLKKFSEDREVEWIPDDLPALQTHPKKFDDVTDIYLAELAARHGARLATLDQRIAHPAVERI